MPAADSTLPQMVPVRQKFERPRVENVRQAVLEQLAGLSLQDTIRPGQSIAITAGSRGIAHIDEIIKACVDFLKEIGGSPFIVPAMGSHAGGTAAGQQELLAGFGITEAAMGCPIRASMDTVVVAQTPQGVLVHFDRFAHEADHVLVVNRVKPHTGFSGSIESGLHKMMLIGLGKRAGAEVYHRAIKSFSFAEIIESVADAVIAECHVVAGLAIVENAYDETAHIEAIAPEHFRSREPELLTLAKSWLPKLPVNPIDLLIVDRIGKDISGTGMDTNIIGRKYNDHVATESDTARCLRIFVRGLTEATHGNACGIGIAEFTNRRTAVAIDPESTRINCIVSGHPTAGMLPMTYETDREAIVDALHTVGWRSPSEARVVHISDTLHLERVAVSEALLAECRDRSDLEVLGSPQPMAFDEAGNLSPNDREAGALTA